MKNIILILGMWPEAIKADVDLILSSARAILARPKSETRLDGTKNPYGDGHAAKKITHAMSEFWK